MTPEVPKLDINPSIRKGSIELWPEEHADDRASRLRREERRDQREHVLFYVVLAAILLVTAIAAWIAFLDRSVDPDTRGYARTLLTSVISGAVFFLFGRALPKP